jgi:hypothetical protein
MRQSLQQDAIRHANPTQQIPFTAEPRHIQFDVQKRNLGKN